MQKGSSYSEGNEELQLFELCIKSASFNVLGKRVIFFDLKTKKITLFRGPCFHDKRSVVMLAASTPRQAIREKQQQTLTTPLD
ncbi:hypothetical protein [Halobacillus litoralis]|uniref:Uncharacterized protein n=1 Tax=Halobacillus litoralis TaxID=45668 RepID=A0A410MHV6_9BACI|nr:hypothetical protein [Halobacillus litoralis]QAS54273.1 hypothetical protein HLI_19660 [Halobacillus litoralis]